MKKSKKEKKKLLASQSEEGYLTTLKKGTEMTLKLHQNPYMVFASSIMERFEYTHIEELKPKVTQFMDNYYLDLLDLDEIMYHSELKNAFDNYLQIVQYYYLFTTTNGKKEFKKIVQWLPTENEQVERLMSWPDNYIISLFQPLITADALYFQNLKDETSYEIYVDDNEVMNTIQENRPIFLALLLPTDGKYIVSPVVECQNYDNLNEILDKNLSKTEWESQLFLWYRENLSTELNETMSDLFNDDFVPDYYSAERFVNESDTDFADRLLKQDPMLYDFPHIQEVKQLLVKVIQTFPQLFIARANVLPLLETLKVIFSDIEIEPENDRYLGDTLSHFWLLLIFEYLPEEVKKTEKFKVDSEYWDEDDNLDLPL
ncbi:hypothetical protein [Tetragenococcus koreensis]|uniref:hypothetical protein n=1 Tax=Tetragenococcus koreensis TaxID=290335 RepID=UPI000F4DD257|nr:hypothetical protein [Tetragenococcus koreensis]AYW44818.1 hypothetical protein C7K43_02065 [Tetragenococcus koreensis]GEN90388.1 hypothetical protein TKO01_04340 [Tetragenococcus koreensis]